MRTLPAKTLRGLSALATRVLEPGVVMMEGFLSMSQQLRITREILKHGQGKNGWLQASDKVHDGRSNDILNNVHHGRGRLYAELNSYPLAGELEAMCIGAANIAMGLECSEMPSITPTHLLSIYYGEASRKLGWHRDDGSHDGASLQPVVSFSIGNSCDFCLKHELRGTPTCVQLHSGDVIMFGGLARHIMHTVALVHSGTCPLQLRDLHSQVLQDGEASWADPGESFRLNLTFRHAPELLGLEDEELFHVLGSRARKFLDMERAVGTAEARQIANEWKAKVKQRKLQHSELHSANDLRAKSLRRKMQQEELRKRRIVGEASEVDCV